MSSTPYKKIMKTFAPTLRILSLLYFFLSVKKMVIKNFIFLKKSPFFVIQHKKNFFMRSKILLSHCVPFWDTSIELEIFFYFFKLFYFPKKNNNFLKINKLYRY
ncbi:MAG: hypothetical protein D6805_02145 [Planctomycetota bacterium]|nr:MAG: hypothetical protein D6805_02145 [Planctomycetota bacterium]